MPDHTEIKYIPGPLVHRCQRCKKPGAGEELLQCNGCQVVRYCSVEHHEADRPSHQSLCDSIKGARLDVAKQEGLIRNATPDTTTPENAFETHVGFFWGVPGTQDYLEATYNLAVSHLHIVGTLDGSREALAQMIHMLSLDRIDSCHVRDVIPHVMLRLGLDQGSCEIIRNCPPSEKGLLGTAEKTDVFGCAESILGQRPNLDHAVASLLLMLKLLVDVINAQKARKVLSLLPLPVEIRNHIEKMVVRSHLSEDLYRETTQALVQRQTKIVARIREYSSVVKGISKGFMSQLLDPDKSLSDEICSDDPLSWYRAATVVKHSYSVWCGTEGVLPLIGDALVLAAKDWMLKREKLKQLERSGPGYNARELARDLIQDGIWRCLEWAVKDATHLGPPSERPSEGYLKNRGKFWDRYLVDEEFESMLEREFFSDEELDGMLEDEILSARRRLAIEEALGYEDDEDNEDDEDEEDDEGEDYGEWGTFDNPWHPDFDMIIIE
ncbi:unnamed protein product [Clonostachys rosea]|uniref:MYND-type domain-containing protein n=1 Tax=Bionectria ochroleuca TaxID=29856 RepID=A0ABY6UFC4_BIOOC|nr:unnamed protein product [Clonostachys rosea]